MLSYLQSVAKKANIKVKMGSFFKRKYINPINKNTHRQLSTLKSVLSGQDI
jgi:hypothetical protein